ncbi:MAG: tRNA dihydrouridine synthase DusB [Melioribacteraceae bacterium]
MQIGNLKISGNTILAPMAEITDFAFRTIARDYEAGLIFTQMVSADGIVKNNFNTLRLLTFSRNEKPIGVQLLAKDPAIVAKAVREIVRLKADIIDLNCGCPVPKVVGNKMGAYLLTQPDLLGRLVKSMVDNSNGIPISIKIRLGFKAKINVLEIAKIIEDNGASMITLHARKRSDRYCTEAQWEWIAKLKESVQIPVVGNGSIFTGKDAMEMIEQTNCDGVLIGRGALGNPFIFKQINLAQKGIDYNPTINEVSETAQKHIDILEREQSFTIHFDRAKKNTIWYFKNYNGIWNLIEQIYTVNTYSELKEAVVNHTKKLNSGFYPDEDLEVINNKFKNKVLFWLSKEDKEKV